MKVILKQKPLSQYLQTIASISTVFQCSKIHPLVTKLW